MRLSPGICTSFYIERSWRALCCPRPMITPVANKPSCISFVKTPIVLKLDPAKPNDETLPCLRRCKRFALCLQHYPANMSKAEPALASDTVACAIIIDEKNS